MPSSTRHKMTVNSNTIYTHHSKSFPARLANAYPGSPMNTSVVANKITDDERREFFADECQSGAFDGFSDFVGSYNYGFEDDSRVSPRQSGVATVGETEALPGAAGSTIAAQGRGPNVATLPSGFSGGNVPATHPNIDAGSGPGSAPFAGTGGGYNGQAHGSTGRVAKPTVEDSLTMGESGVLGEPVGALITPLDNAGNGNNGNADNGNGGNAGNGN